MNALSGNRRYGSRGHSSSNGHDQRSRNNRAGRPPGGGRGSGFTLVELLTAAVVASVLALTAGIMLVFTSQACQRHLLLAEMQSDLRVAVPTVSMAIREAREADVTAPAVGGSGPRLTLGSRSFYRADAALGFDAAGRTLAYDPDTGVADDEVALCRNRVNAFTCTRGTNAVTFDLVLQEGDDTVQINGQAFFRN